MIARRSPVPFFVFFLFLGLIFVQPASTGAEGGNLFLAPGIWHTNGMRIASSEPHRTSSVDWTCNPEKLGYCGGNYYRPCIDSVRIRSLRRAQQGCYWHPSARYRSSGCGLGEAVAPSVPYEYEGVEPAGMAELGRLPVELFGGAGASPIAPAGPVLGR